MSRDWTSSLQIQNLNFANLLRIWSWKDDMQQPKRQEADV